MYGPTGNQLVFFPTKFILLYSDVNSLNTLAKSENMYLLSQSSPINSLRIRKRSLDEHLQYVIFVLANIGPYWQCRQFPFNKCPFMSRFQFISFLWFKPYLMLIQFLALCCMCHGVCLVKKETFFTFLARNDIDFMLRTILCY